uniref:coagulation factor Xa n=1 Tax=Gouania willdenowi TaxID=441366 RepID=A0A8C5DUB3_GOUWI
MLNFVFFHHLHRPAFSTEPLKLLSIANVSHLSAVFYDSPAANQVLARQRRANAFLEEMKQGDMERECIEERCSFEEAKEIFQDMEKTVQKYLFPIAFTSQPCAHDGVCKDGIGTYACQCQTGYEGSNCEIVIFVLTCPNTMGLLGSASNTATRHMLH